MNRITQKLGHDDATRQKQALFVTTRTEELHIEQNRHSVGSDSFGGLLSPVAAAQPKTFGAAPAEALATAGFSACTTTAAVGVASETSSCTQVE
jgi:hypothetical protein